MNGPITKETKMINKHIKYSNLTRIIKMLIIIVMTINSVSLYYKIGIKATI